MNSAKKQATRETLQAGAAHVGRYLRKVTRTARDAPDLEAKVCAESPPAQRLTFMPVVSIDHVQLGGRHDDDLAGQGVRTASSAFR